MIKQDVVDRLSTLGYTAVQADDLLITFLMNKIEDHIRNQCNTSAIPEGLQYKAIDMVSYEVLITKIGTGELDVDAAIAAIKEGDTQVDFNASGDLKAQYAQYINSLVTPGDFAKYRLFTW